LFSFPRGTEMFQFPRFPLPSLCVQEGVTPHDGCGVSPFGHPRIEAWSAAPRGFSQPPTSFIGIRRQGIHRWLFVAWRIKDARARYGILKGRCHPDRGPRRPKANGVMEVAATEGFAPSKRNRRVRLPSPSAWRTSPTTSVELEKPSSACIDWESARTIV
jgi:hypothetical protein